MKRGVSPLNPSQINETLLNGLGETLARMGRRWRRLDQEELKAMLLDLQKRRKDIIRQEDLYPPNDPLRLSVQCQRAVMDLHLLELRKVSGEMGVSVTGVWGGAINSWGE